MNDILIALEIYFLGFIVAVIMAAMIKYMVVIIRRVSPEEKSVEKREGESV